MKANGALIDILNLVAEQSDKDFLTKMYRALYEVESAYATDDTIIFDAITLCDKTILYNARMGEKATLFVQYDGEYPQKLYHRDRYEGIPMAMEGFWENHFPKKEWADKHGIDFPREIISFETFNYIPLEVHIKLLEKQYLSTNQDGVYPMVPALTEYICKEGIGVLKDVALKLLEEGGIEKAIRLENFLESELKSFYNLLLTEVLSVDRGDLSNALVKEYCFYNHTYYENNNFLKWVMKELGLPEDGYPEPERGWAGRYDVVVQYEPSYIQCECGEISPYSGNECNCPFCGCKFAFNYDYV